MALYHCSITPVSRGEGRSAVAAAAYRACTVLRDERTGITHDFRRKRGHLHAALILPGDAPAWAHERAALWNGAEAAERVNGCPARDIEFALPHELSRDAQDALAEAVARQVSARYGTAIDLNVHAPPRRGDARNVHAHLLMSTRRLGPEGFGAKTRELDDRRRGPEEIRCIRRMVAGLTNRFLAEAGLETRVDERSLAERGIARTPTVHEGPRVRAMSRRDIPTDRAAENASIRLWNGAQAFAPSVEDDQAVPEAAPEPAPALEEARSGEIRPAEGLPVSGGCDRTADFPQAIQEAATPPEPARAEEANPRREQGELRRPGSAWRRAAVLPVLSLPLRGIFGRAGWPEWAREAVRMMWFARAGPHP